VRIGNHMSSDSSIRPCVVKVAAIAPPLAFANCVARGAVDAFRSSTRQISATDPEAALAYFGPDDCAVLAQFGAKGTIPRTAGPE
jgi:hypothetical protein